MLPVTIEPRMQKDAWDCGLACLEMLTGVPYPELLKHTRKYRKPQGLSNRQMLSIARKVGAPLRYSQKVTELSVGILDLQRPEGANPACAGDANGEWEGHFAILAKGMVYNPGAGVWWMEVADFLAHHRWQVVGIFTRRD